VSDTRFVTGDGDGLTYIFGEDEALARAACSRIPWGFYHPGMMAVGVATGPDLLKDKLLCVCIYHTYLAPKEIAGETWFNSCEIGFVAFRPAWARRDTIRNLLKVPFDQYKVEQVFVTVPSINDRAIRLAKGIGFTPRGTVSRYYSKTVHACVFGLHRNQFKSPQFLQRKGEQNGRPEHERRQGRRQLATAST
jgi:hypothetical protein